MARRRVSLFVTCFNDTLFPEAGRAAVRVLERLGCRVSFPLEQTCCGQMHYNSGYQREAERLMRHQLDVFAGDDAVVTPSASCAGTMREGYARIASQSADAVLVREVGALASRVYELSEFVVGVLGTVDVGAYYPHRVTYHPTCHSLRSLGVGDAPVRLLQSVRGIDLVDLPEASECCGFGGLFSVKNAEVSSAMLADKVGHVLATGAEVLCALDTSCLAHIGGALSRQRTGVRTVHLAEVLAASDGG